LAEDLSVLDVGVLPNPWNDIVFSKYANKKKLKFGYYFDDGVTIASPPVERAVLMTAKALQAQGHEVVSIVPPNVVEAVQCFVALTTYDGSVASPSISSFPHLCLNLSPFPASPLFHSIAKAVGLRVDTPTYANQSPKTQWSRPSNSSSH